MGKILFSFEKNGFTHEQGWFHTWAKSDSHKGKEWFTHDE
jgi:hypothetical protein